MKFVSDYTPHFGGFHHLIKFRVRDILLVSSYYDAFVLEEDGRLSEKIFSEYIDLNLRFIPRIVRVSTAQEALSEMKRNHYDLVITMTRISDMDLMSFGAAVKSALPDMPVVMLTYDWVDVSLLRQVNREKSIDKVFYWSGDTRILLAIIKYVEDMKNVDNDVGLGVRVILLIEDSPKFYSLYLPVIYTEIMTQTRALISEGVNDLHRLLRMRARPKILMAETFEDGMALYHRYQDNLLGVISDVRFPCEGKVDPEAGFRFASLIRSEFPDLPFLIQSSSESNRKPANAAGLAFLHKQSENLMTELHEFILTNFGFGDFVFRTHRGKEVGRASSLIEFEQAIKIIPDDSLAYHAERNHISIWLRARTEFELAEKLRPRKVSDYASINHMRQNIVQEINRQLQRNQTGVISDFGSSQYDVDNSFVRIGNGSLGGKARGIAFLNDFLTKSGLNEKFPEVEIRTPHTFVICSEMFEEFIESNHLQRFAMEENDSGSLARRFLRARLPRQLQDDLAILLDEIHYPLAVRSSSLLEDSQLLPFAGLYSTYMLANNQASKRERLKLLTEAVKLIYASVFYRSPKEYVRNTNFRVEEEKMAVIVQQLVGRVHGERFYPVVSGVAQSYNFYPFSHMSPDEGVVELALGLGAIIVEGGKVFRFSPHYPEMNPPYSSPADFMKNTQNRFYALNLTAKTPLSTDEKFNIDSHSLQQAEEDGTLFLVGSTFSAENNAVCDTLSIPGYRMVTFAHILKYGTFPLADILRQVLSAGREAFGSHIEMEFAINIDPQGATRPEFYLLQIRPMVVGREKAEISMEDIDPSQVILSSRRAMGNGVLNGLRDIVYLPPERFDVGSSRRIAAEIAEVNKKLIEMGRNYVLIGFGRWATSDPWLGIPIEWHQMSNARLIVESFLGDFQVDPSLGSHFFHNLISLKMGYFHVGRRDERNFVDFDRLRTLPALYEGNWVRHVHTDRPLQVVIDGRQGCGAVALDG